MAGWCRLCVPFFGCLPPRSFPLGVRRKGGFYILNVVLPANFYNHPTNFLITYTELGDTLPTSHKIYRGSLLHPGPPGRCVLICFSTPRFYSCTHLSHQLPHSPNCSCVQPLTLLRLYGVYLSRAPRLLPAIRSALYSDETGLTLERGSASLKSRFRNCIDSKVWLGSRLVLPTKFDVCHLARR